MSPCDLNDLQKTLLRSLVPGLKHQDGTVNGHWLVAFFPNGSMRIQGLADEIWEATWRGKVGMMDLKKFVECGFFKERREGEYFLAANTIIDAADNDFAIQPTSIEAMNAYLPRIFISYKRQDAHYTEQLANHLSRIFGFESTWFDRRLYGGQVWWNEVLRQISERNIFVYLLSPEAIASIYCRLELTEAWRQNKQIIPIKIRDSRYPEEISRFQILSFSPNITASEIVEVIATITQPTEEIPFVPQSSLWETRTTQPTQNHGIQIRIKIPAIREPNGSQRELCNTGILLVPGDKINITAKGKISVDNGQTWMNSSGLYPDPNEPHKTIFVWSEAAYRAKGFLQPISECLDCGIIGSLFGWIGERNHDSGNAFFVGEQFQKEVTSGEGGFLYLAVNDTKSMYIDNVGEFDVTIEIENQGQL